jgi:hypothetical protein
MAGRIWLKFGRSAQEGWQSVLNKKIKKVTFENLQFHENIFRIMIFFLLRAVLEPHFRVEQLCYPGMDL